MISWDRVACSRDSSRFQASERFTCPNSLSVALRTGDYSGCLAFGRIQTQLFLSQMCRGAVTLPFLTGALSKTRTGKILERELTSSGKVGSDAPALGA